MSSEMLTLLSIFALALKRQKMNSPLRRQEVVTELILKSIMWICVRKMLSERPSCQKVIFRQDGFLGTPKSRENVR
ncbi:hypothetical protein SDC9_60982 [bioreactor metagenome]|uniref:IS4 family transposase n=1 Tax=bioreactor metagenome TaxID=1076179 RepID=A0A644XFR3_9ZZZZ